MGLEKKLASVFAAVVLGTGAVTGAAALINGVERDDAAIVDIDNGGPEATDTLQRMRIKPVFEKQTLWTYDGHRYDCWSVASIKCSMQAPDKDKDAYNAMVMRLPE